MAAAAKHLTPVTLELGGKSPVVVDSNINVKVIVFLFWWQRDLSDYLNFRLVVVHW